MATSGSVNYSINRDQIIKGALRKIGVLSRGTTPSSEDISEGAEALNLIVKQWMGNTDFAPGLKVWTRKRGTVFPALNTSEYTIGPNGDHATLSFVQTTSTAAVAFGTADVACTSVTGMTAGDYFGIRQDDNSIFWSTIQSIASLTVTLDDNLDYGIGSSGATVYAYTTKLLMPLDIISLRRKNTSNSESTLTPMLIDEYEAIGDKSINGTPTRYLYEQGLTDGLLKFDQGISDTTDVYPITFLSTVEDFDSASDTPDYPQRWYRPLELQLAIDLASERGKESKIPALNAALWGDKARDIPGAIQIAQNADPENVVAFFEADT